MYLIALLIGLLSYSILFIGLNGQLTQINLLVLGFIFSLTVGFIISKSFPKFYNFFKSLGRIDVIICVLLVLLIIINFVGALGPELAFDSLWYHLTIPKLFNIHNKVYFIEGNLFYYSLMPKLTEMIYSAVLLLGSEIYAKVIHFLFGIFSIFALYRLATEYLSKRYALISISIFYSSLVVSWLSITAYSDLSRALYEILALICFLLFAKNVNSRYLILSGFFLGLAVSAKIIALGTLIVFICLILLMDKIELKEKLHKIFLLSFVTIMVPMPWFVISFYHTNNPFYPLFTHLMLRNSLIDLLNPIFFLKTIFQTLLFAPDPINPFYLISIPLIIIYSKKLFKKYKILLIYSALTFMIWYLTSQSGGTRFLSSYLPAYTVLGLLAFKELKSKISVNFLLIITFFTILTSIVYRGVANSKNLPVIIGIQSKQDFLMKNLNFSFGDFYDENDEIKKLVGKNLVLIHGIHNLYYVDFNYTISEWDNFKEAKFLLMQSGELPKEYKNANLIYSNPKTKVKLYKL